MSEANRHISKALAICSIAAATMLAGCTQKGLIEDTDDKGAEVLREYQGIVASLEKPEINEVRVLYVHGMGHNCVGYASEFAINLATALGAKKEEIDWEKRFIAKRSTDALKSSYLSFRVSKPSDIKPYVKCRDIGQKSQRFALRPIEQKKICDQRNGPKSPSAPEGTVRCTVISSQKLHYDKTYLTRVGFKSDAVKSKNGEGAPFIYGFLNRYDFRVGDSGDDEVKTLRVYELVWDPTTRLNKDHHLLFDIQEYGNLNRAPMNDSLKTNVINGSLPDPVLFTSSYKQYMRIPVLFALCYVTAPTEGTDFNCLQRSFYRPPTSKSVESGDDSLLPENECTWIGDRDNAPPGGQALAGDDHKFEIYLVSHSLGTLIVSDVLDYVANQVGDFTLVRDKWHDQAADCDKNPNSAACEREPGKIGGFVWKGDALSDSAYRDMVLAYIGAQIDKKIPEQPKGSMGFEVSEKPDQTELSEQKRDGSDSLIVQQLVQQRDIVYAAKEELYAASANNGGGEGYVHLYELIKGIHLPELQLLYDEFCINLRSRQDNKLIRTHIERLKLQTKGFFMFANQMPLLCVETTTPFDNSFGTACRFGNSWKEFFKPEEENGSVVGQTITAISFSDKNDVLTYDLSLVKNGNNEPSKVQVANVSVDVARRGFPVIPKAFIDFEAAHTEYDDEEAITAVIACGADVETFAYRSSHDRENRFPVIPRSCRLGPTR